ncbi:MAG: ATP-binding protein [Sphaerochaetaceae bacterium]|nr:ATP-binding protein [Sphaerochaetaceae bacterium]
MKKFFLLDITIGFFIVFLLSGVFIFASLDKINEQNVINELKDVSSLILKNPIEINKLKSSDININYKEDYLEEKQVINTLEDNYNFQRRGNIVSLSFVLIDDNLVTLSKNIPTFSQTFLKYWKWLFPLGLLIFGILYLFTVFISNKLMKTINGIDFNEVQKFPYQKEFLPFLEKINTQKREVEKSDLALAQRRREFQAVTQNLQEGLLVLNKDLKVYSINSSAEQIFNTTIEKCGGKYFLEVSNHKSIQKALENATTGRHAEVLFNHHSKFYRIFSNPIVNNGIMSGIVLLFWDVTEQQTAENSRMEFSANVSHELKTPLTSISGYAEIMKAGIAKSEDMVKFSEKIYLEANRLVTLINDIIKLSKLDESQNLEKEPVDLLHIINEVSQRYSKMAEKKGISIEIIGHSQIVFGIYGLLDEMVKNLIENALKYNVENGKVKIEISESENFVKLTVSDTGMGIPYEFQERVFERFFRVDKSHSKETGGTGLGLSIVKHVAIIHNAKILLKSKIGKGTTISIIFPKILEKELE